MGIPLAGRSSYERERGEKEETSAAAGALSYSPLVLYASVHDCL